MAYRVMEWVLEIAQVGGTTLGLKIQPPKGLSFAVKLINKSRLKFMRPPNN